MHNNMPKLMLNLQKIHTFTCWYLSRKLERHFRKPLSEILDYEIIEGIETDIKAIRLATENTIISYSQSLEDYDLISRDINEYIDIHGFRKTIIRALYKLWRQIIMLCRESVRFCFFMLKNLYPYAHVNKKDHRTGIILQVALAAAFVDGKYYLGLSCGVCR